MLKKSTAMKAPCTVTAGANTLVLFSIAWAFKKAFGEEPVAQATSLEETLQSCLKLSPQILTLDLSLGEEECLAMIRQVVQRNPPPRILILGGGTKPDQIYRLIKEGVYGYFDKFEHPNQLIVALNNMHLGKRYLSPEAIEVLSTHMNQKESVGHQNELTHRELELLKSFALGQSVKEISASLNISEKTIYAHRSSILQKTTCKDNVGLTHYAFKHGIIEHR